MYKNTKDDPYYQAIAYRGKRITQYPQIHEQLDMLWHDINNGLFGEAAKDSLWFKSIQQIREDNPKPTE